MAKVDGSAGSLVQGVSQQPPRARLPGQAEEQTNVSNDEVFGISRRPITNLVEHSARYARDTNLDNFVEHGDFRMDDELIQHTFRIVNDPPDPQMRILRNGTSIDVALDASSHSYLTVDPTVKPYGDRVVFKEVGDKVFVLNTQRTVTKLAGAPTYSSRETTVVFCRGGQYAVGYTLKFTVGGNTHQVTFSTPDGSVSGHTPLAKVKYIISQLFELCSSTDNGAADGSSSFDPLLVDASDNSWTPDPGIYYASAGAKAAISGAFHVRQLGEHLLIRPKTLPLDYTLTATETSGAELLMDVRDEVADVGRLPTRAPVGMVLKVAGSNRAEDDYYLQWLVDDLAVNSEEDLKGSWEECTAPDEDYRMDPETLPHELYNDSGTFRIRAMEWADRLSGSDLSNPFPNFVGSTIQDISDLQGRALFLHDGDVSLSTSQKYWNWFKQTATTKLATDPINMFSTAGEGDSNLIYAVAFKRDMVLFGTNNTQFMIDGRVTITSDNASISLTSEFDCDLTTRPKAVGDSIVFLSYTGKFTQVHELYLEGDRSNHARRTVTDHVPRYLPGKPTALAADDGTNTVLVMTDADATQAFLYEFLWLDDRRVQSAWSTWAFDAPVVAARIERGELHMVFQTLSGGFLNTVSPLDRTDMQDLDFPLHMDYAQIVELDAEIEFTVHCSGYSDDITKLRVVALTGSAVAGMPLSLASATPVVQDAPANQVTIRLNAPYTGRVVFGTLFATRFIPTMPIFKDRDGVAVSHAHLTVVEFDLTFTQTGPFTMTRQSVYELEADWWSQKYSGRTLGDPDFILGTAPIDSDVLSFAFDDDVTTSKLVIDCDSHLPMTFTEIEWRGNLRNRSRRLSNGG